MIVARRPRLLLSRSAAATVSSVDCPLRCSTRANVRTRSDRSTRFISAHPTVVSHWRTSGSFCHIWFHHLAWIDDAIKFILGYKAQFQGGILEREIIVHGVVGNLRCLVVPNDRRKRRYQH